MPITIKELLGNQEGQSENSSDSDEEQPSQPPEPQEAPKQPRKKDDRLKKIIDEINGSLKAGKAVDLSQYPALFVVHFRGVHFFTQFMTQAERRTLRKAIYGDTFKEGIYSPAVYELAGLKLGEPIDSEEKKLKVLKAIETLREEFELLAKAESKESSWWGKKRAHDKEIHRHFQRYVNAYAEFREESEAKQYSCYQNLTAKKNPYVSTADLALHAVLYALGGKTTLEQGALRPTYISHNGKPKAKHPKVGYVQIIFHKLTSLKKNQPLFLSMLHASHKIDIKERLLNERETTFKTAIAAKHVMSTTVVRYPSFHLPFEANYHPAKYGIENKSSYSKFANSFFSQKTINSTLLDKLAEHYAKQLLERAEEMAANQNGYLVYLGLDGLLKEHVPTTQSISTARQAKEHAAIEEEFNAIIDLYKTEAELSESYEELRSLDLYTQKLKKSFDNIQNSKAELNCKTKLKEQANLCGFDCRDVPGDGNCFYYALLDQLQNVLAITAFQDLTVEGLIALGVEEIIENIDFYQVFHNGSVDELIEQLLTANEWADHLIMQALAHKLMININLIRSDAAENSQIEVFNPVAIVNLGYEVGLHYQSLIPVRRISQDSEEKDFSTANNSSVFI